MCYEAMFFFHQFCDVAKVVIISKKIEPNLKDMKINKI
jgi:hypothetical protein